MAALQLMLPILMAYLLGPMAATAQCNCSALTGVPLATLATRHRPAKFLPQLHMGYHRFYNFIFEPMRFSPVRVMEVNSQYNDMAKLWKEYFTSVELFALALHNGASPASKEVNSVAVFAGPPGNVSFIQEVVAATAGDFDAVLVNGGQLYSHQLGLYRLLFLKALKSGGIYIMENVETSYWKDFVLDGVHFVGGVHNFSTLISAMKLKAAETTRQKQSQALVEGMAFFPNLVVLYKRGFEGWTQREGGCDCRERFNRLLQLERKHRPAYFFPILHGNYHAFYDSLLEPLRHTPTVRLLLVSTSKPKATGCKMWQDYFEEVVCLQLQVEMSRRGQAPNSNGDFVGNPDNATFLRALVERAGGNFDVIIDSGAYDDAVAINNYQVLLPDALRLGGVYVMWGVQADKCQGDRVALHALCYFRRAVDVLNRKFHDNYFTVGSPMDWWIKGIGFFARTIVLLKKDTHDRPYDAHYIWSDRLHEPAKSQGAEQQWGPSPL